MGHQSNIVSSTNHKIILYDLQKFHQNIMWNLVHTVGEVTEDNEKTLSSGWNFLDLFKLQE